MTRHRPIFSGDYSAPMWDRINRARTVVDLRHALYFVCCRLQEMETVVRGGPARGKGKTARRTKRAREDR